MESILFGSKHKLKSNTDLNVTCNHTPISSTKSVKYLGAVLDKSLVGEMASGIFGKVYSRIKFLYWCSKFFDIKTRKLLASALIQCHYDYACSLWYSSLTKSTKSKLQISQNKLVRFTLKLHSRTHLDLSHFETLGWLPIKQRVNQRKLNHVYRALNDTALIMFRTCSK